MTDRLHQTLAWLCAVQQAVQQAIAAQHPREQLLDAVCRALVAAGGLRLVWLGRRAEQIGPLDTLATAQAPGPGLQPLGQPLGQLSGQDLGAPHGPAAQALQAGSPQWWADVVDALDGVGLADAGGGSDASLAPGAPAGANSSSAGAAPGQGHRRGQAALVALPVVREGAPRVCLCLVTDQPQPADAQQLALLAQLGLNLGLALDLTAARQGRARERGLRQQLVASVAGLFFVLDAQGALLLWNHPVEAMCLAVRRQPRGTTLHQLMQDHERAPMVQQLARVLALAVDDDSSVQVEVSLPAPGGRRTPYLLVLRRIQHEGHTIAVGTGIDISDRVQAAAELARHQLHLESLVATRTRELASANARMYREDRRLRTMLSLSQQASALSQQQLLQRGVDELTRLSDSPAAALLVVDDRQLDFDAVAVHATPEPSQPSDRADLTALAVQALQQRRLLHAGPPDTLAAAAATAGHGTALAVPVVEGNQARLVLVVAGRLQPYNATDERELVLLGADLWRMLRRRRVEIALEAAKREADAANHAKSAFLANIGHEVRTPLNAVIGFAHLLQREQLLPRQHDHLDKIAEAGRHLLQVIDDILEFSRMEGQPPQGLGQTQTQTQTQTQVQALSLRSLLEGVLTTVAGRAQAKGITLHLQLADGPDRVLADRARLAQVLRHLVGNAIKFTPRGQVTLRVRWPGQGQPVAPGTTPPTLRIEVEDSGIGLSPTQITGLFEAFTQADVSTTRRFGGSGLGLAISKQLTELMQGRLGVHSQAGAGSLFWLELPVQPLADGADLSGQAANAAGPAVVPDRVRLVGAPTAPRAPPAHRQRALASAPRLPTGTKPRYPATRLPAEAAQPSTAPPTAPPTTLRTTALTEQDHRHTRLAHVPGLDTTQGLACVSGLMPLYHRSLGLFVAHHGDDPKHLPRLAQAQDLHGLKQLAHSLVGAAATLGAEPVRALAQQLEHTLDQALLAGAPAPAPGQPAWPARVGPLAEALQALLDALHEALRAASGSDTAGAHTAGAGDSSNHTANSTRTNTDAHTGPAAAPARTDPDAVRALLQRLQQLQPLLHSHDTAAGERVDAAQALLATHLGPLAQQLAAQIHSFSFEDAQHTMALALQRAHALAAEAVWTPSGSGPAP